MPLDPSTQLNLVESFEDAENLMRWLGERHENDAIAIDTETTGLDPREPGAAIRLIQFGDTRAGWSVPWQDWRGLALEVLRRYEGLQVYHNLAFEARWIHHHSDYRIPRDRSVDTMIAAHIINPVGSGALKTLSNKYVDRKASAGQQDLDRAMAENGWTWATIPVNFQPFWLYASLDVVLTANLWGVFKPDLTDAGPYTRVFDLEMAVRHICLRMEERGAHIDLEYSQVKGDELGRYAKEISAWGKEAFGINLASTQQLGKKVLELGGEFLEYTKTGQPKTDKASLKLLANPDNGYPEAVQALATQTLALRDSRRISSTYFGSFLKRSYDGRIHPEIRTLGARTARMSMADPPIQQLPKKSPLVRGAVIPTDPEHCIITTDYSQIEMRLLAEFSNDADLTQAFNIADATGGDFFVEVGKLVYHDPSFQKSDRRRGLIKNTSYAMIYGAGPAKMAESAGVPEAVMMEVIDALHTRFPGIKRFMTSVEETGQYRKSTEGEAYVITPTGRRLPADDDRVFTLVNYAIQSTAADVLKEALVRLDAAGYEDWMVFPVHDEVVMDIPREHAAQALVEVPKIMAEMDHAVPLTAESDGPLSNWGEKYA